MTVSSLPRITQPHEANPSLYMSSMYSNIQDRIDNLQEQIDLTQSYVKMISRDVSQSNHSTAASISTIPHISSKNTKATSISSKQSVPPTDTTDTAYLIQLPQAIVLAMIAGLMTGLLHYAITRLASIAECDQTRHLRHADILTNYTVTSADTSDVSSVRTLTQLHSAACAVLTQPLLISQLIVWGPITTLAIINGILVTDVQLLDREGGNVEDDISDYEDFEEAEVIRINDLLSDIGNIKMNNIQ